MPWLSVNQTGEATESAVPTPLLALDVHLEPMPGAPVAKSIMSLISASSVKCDAVCLADPNPDPVFRTDSRVAFHDRPRQRQAGSSWAARSLFPDPTTASTFPPDKQHFLQRCKVRTSFRDVGARIPNVGEKVESGFSKIPTRRSKQPDHQAVQFNRLSDWRAGPMDESNDGMVFNRFLRQPPGLGKSPGVIVKNHRVTISGPISQ